MVVVHKVTDVIYAEDFMTTESREDVETLSVYRHLIIPSQQKIRFVSNPLTTFTSTWVNG